MKNHTQVWLVLCLLSVIIIEKVELRTVHCRRKKNEDPEYLSGGKECYCFNVSGPPWSPEGVRTAPAPYNSSSDLKTYILKNKSRIGLDIAWQQKGTDIKDISPGYYIEIVQDNNEVWQYECHIKVENAMTEMIEFHYIFKADPPHDDIKPKEIFHIKIYALPMHNANDTPSFVNHIADIPDCGSLLHNTQPCIEERIRQKKERIRRKEKRKGTTYNEKNENTIIIENRDTLRYEHTILIVVFGILALITVIAIAAYKTSHGRNIPVKIQHILIIGDNNTRYTPVVNRIIEILHVHNVEIYSNIRQTSEVGHSGIIRWATEKLELADVAIFVVNDSSQLINEDITQIDDNEKYQKYSPVGIAISLAESLALKGGFTNSKRKLIAIDLSGCISDTRLLAFEVYNAERDFKKLLKHALGPYYTEENLKLKKEMLLKLISVSRQNSRSDDIDSHETKEEPTILISNIQQTNNLDNSIPHECELTPLNSLNIEQEQLPSVECNECR